MAENGAATNGLAGQSWVQTPSRKKIAREVSSLPGVGAQPPQAIGAAKDLEVASKAPKLDKMEVVYYDELMALCSKEGITPTTLMEGVLIVLAQHEDIKAEIVEVGKDRRKIRVEQGQRKRIEAGMRKLQEGL